MRQKIITDIVRDRHDRRGAHHYWCSGPRLQHRRGLQLRQADPGHESDRRNARREMMLAWRSMLDHAIKKMDEKA